MAPCQCATSPGDGFLEKKLWMLLLWGDGAERAPAAASGLRRFAEEGGFSSQPQASHFACMPSSVSSVQAGQARGAVRFAKWPSGDSAAATAAAGVGGADAGPAACSGADAGASAPGLLRMKLVKEPCCASGSGASPLTRGAAPCTSVGLLARTAASRRRTCSAMRCHAAGTQWTGSGYSEGAGERRTEGEGQGEGIEAAVPP